MNLMRVLKNILFLLAFFVVILILIFIIAKKDGEIANIYYDGELIESINLSDVKQRYTIDIKGHNKVLAENGQISMIDADCPDKLCIKQGAIKDAGYPIVCLPNKVIIRIEE